MRRTVLLVAGLLMAVLPGVAQAREVRLFTVSPRFDLSWVDTIEHFREKVLTLGGGLPRTPDSPVQEGVADVRSRLLGPGDAKRPVQTARDLITLPEDLGLMAAFTGSRATAARSSDGLVGAVAGLIGTYAPVNAYYLGKYPKLAQRPLPTRLLSLALTDTFVRTGVESFAELAQKTRAYVVAGVTLAQDWQVVCTDKASYVAPPGAGPCAVEDPERVALLRSPDEPERTYAYEATTDKPSTLALVFDPSGKLIAKTVKAYLTPVELPSQLDLVPGEVDGIRAIPTPVGRLGIVTSKDAWMPDVTRKLDQQRTEILIQPEFFVGSVVSTKGPWNPDLLQGSGAADVLRHPQLQAMAMPQLVGNVFDFSSDAQAHITTRKGRAGGLVGQPPAPGFAAVAPWVIGEPSGSFAVRRRKLGEAGEKLLPGGPTCASPRRAGPCAGGQVESVLSADVRVGETPRYRRTKTRRVSERSPFTAARPLSSGRTAQRNVSLASRGRLVYAAWEERRGGRDHVFLASSRDGGRTFARPVGLGEGWWPSVSAGADGQVWVAWERRDRVLVASSRDRGRRFSAARSAPGAVEPGGSARAAQHKPAVVATTGRRAYLTWIDERNGSPTDGLPQAGLYGAQLRAGAKPGVARRLDSTGPTAMFAEELDHAWAPSLAARGSRVSISWVDFRGYDWSVFARDSRNGGRSFGSERRLNDRPTDIESLDDAPAVAITARGRGLAAFTDWVNPVDSIRTPSGLYDTQVARTDGSGSPRQVDGDGRAHRSTFSPAAATVGEELLVAWQDGRRATGRIRVSRTSGTRISRPVPVAVSGAGQFRPALVVGGARAIVAWEDHRDGPSRIYVSRAITRQLR